MKKILALMFIGLGLSACGTTTATVGDSEDGGTRLATQSDMSAIVGKTLKIDENSIVISADGTLSGTWGGEPISGTYEMRDGYFCRTLSRGTRGATAEEDCQVFVLDGNMLNGTRDRGNGASFTYTVS